MPLSWKKQMYYILVLTINLSLNILVYAIS